jgi:aspartate aminotransferase
LLNPGEEVIAIAPYFVEYGAYTKNQGGSFKTVNAVEGTFDLDVDAIERAITPKTKAIILNSPNNPTGTVYPEETLQKLAGVLSALEAKGQTVYVISDEPYIKIVYDGVKVPAMLSLFKNSIIVNSFSKSLALPGERIGYIVVNPAIDGAEILMDGMIICARTLGYVNAPSLFQKVIADNLELATGVASYYERRNVLYDIITRAGFSCRLPEGAFYLFPKSPVPDDKAFCNKALEHNLIAVSGAGFGYPGYFRLAYCVSMDNIKRSEKAWMALGKEYGLI